MKIELCAFSGYKIYPGHGKRMVKADGKVFQFLNAKCEASHMLKRNPREVTWTVLYRRKHKKGIEEETTKKRTKRTVKYQRAIMGASLADIMAKRNQKPEVRKAQREQAIRATKRSFDEVDEMKDSTTSYFASDLACSWLLPPPAKQPLMSTFEGLDLSKLRLEDAPVVGMREMLNRFLLAQKNMNWVNPSD
ncbi:unnamed protein product [Cyprideis torosa]|uniref:Large ribosomal subunit protein eL24 n=1 Tax=Cyprideis torosa TaxID=163714 RepID=A0A7R8WCZ2_9CRUS|nr:unnamed protein product [Cyprideis torosa]CAG0894079.1 unnamed protein product [Cyprideis torosa]